MKFGMIQILVLWMIFPFISHSGFGQANTGEIRKSLAFRSSLLKKEIRYSVYLPPGYKKGEKGYSVLYLLHGLGDNEQGWLKYGKCVKTADYFINQKLLSPFIMIMPSAGKTFYINQYDGKYPWEDMFIKEFIPAVEKQFDIQVKANCRVVAGLSMGGYGALSLTLRHPELFTYCLAFSAALRYDAEIIAENQERYDTVYAPAFGVKGLEDSSRITSSWLTHHPLHLVENSLRTENSHQYFYLDCGADDKLLTGNRKLQESMQKKNLQHEFISQPGGHSWIYWEYALFRGMTFLSKYQKYENCNEKTSQK